jgi:hypothetical protein
LDSNQPQDRKENPATPFDRHRLRLGSTPSVEVAMMEKIEREAAKLGILGKYSYAWITLAFFTVSLVLHWYFGWRAFQEDAAQHGQPAELSAFAIEAARDTFENWQSEFLQLLWQVVGLAYFLYLGSPSSKENDDRLEAKIDELIRLQMGDQAEAKIAQIDRDYLRHHGHARPVGAGRRQSS